MKTDAALLIIGAGPAGLMAAWTAARLRPPGGVLVVDRLPVAGAKLAATGGGRGNLSHVATEEEFAAAFGRHGRFTLPAFRALPPDRLREVFR
jgi:predicted flavoprotein YhiN